MSNNFADGKWCCGIGADLEHWTSTEFYGTKEEAIRAGQRVAKAYNEGFLENSTETEDVLGFVREDFPLKRIATFAIGHCFSPGLGLDVDTVLDSVYENVYGEIGDFAENYLDDVTEKHKDELEDLILGWFEKHDYYPTGYTVHDVEEVLVYE